VLPLSGFAALGTRGICLQAWFDAAFVTTGLTAQEMGGGETIVDFSLLMMKSMTTPASVSIADSMQKFTGSSMSLALITTGGEVLFYCTSYFVMAILLSSILGLLMFRCNLPISWHFL